jgi:predicted RNase H-like HicB family nuclease
MAGPPEEKRPGSGRVSTFVVEKHPDGYIAYPVGLKGIVVGQGASHEEALADAKSALRFHIDTFGENREG